MLNKFADATKMKNLSLRTAALKDLPILYEFEQGIVSTERPYNETLKLCHINYYDHKSLIEFEESEVIVAEINGAIFGSAYINIKIAASYLKHTHYGYLVFMFVKPAFRGQGINQKKLEVLKTEPSKKHNRITLRSL